MSAFDMFKRKVTETAKVAAKKSSEFVEITKLKLSIDKHEDEMNEIFQHVGNAIYERYKNENEAFLEYSEGFEKIKNHEETLKQINQKILDLKNIKVCKNCQSELEQEMQFCSKCGEKQ